MSNPDLPETATDTDPAVAPPGRAVDNPERSRFELVIDGRLTGFVTYVMAGGVLVLDHAEIDASQRGQGLGALLVRDVLDDLLRRGVVIEPRCPFVADFIRDHPEYAGMVDRGRGQRASS